MKPLLRSSLESKGALILEEIFAMRLTANDKEILDIWTDFFRKILTKEYGGTSLYITQGSYIMESGDYVDEVSNLVEVATPDATQVFYFLAERIVRYLLSAEQETVYLSVNGVVAIANYVQIREAIWLCDLAETVVLPVEDTLEDFAPLPWSFSKDCFVDNNGTVILRPAVLTGEETDTLVKFLLRLVNGE